MKHKKFLLFGIIFLIMHSISANAAISDGFKNVFKSINDFFVDESYKSFTKLIDFLIYIFLFASLLTMGAKNAFPNFNKQIRMVIILLSITLSFILVIAGISIMSLASYGLYLIYFIGFLVGYWILGKIGIENIFLKALLALSAVALVIIISSLITSGENGFLESLNDKLLPIGSFEIEQSTRYQNNLGQSQNFPVYNTNNKGGKRGNTGLLNIIPIALILIFIIALSKRIKNKFERKKISELTTKEERLSALDNLKAEINNLNKKEDSILKRINEILKQKEPLLSKYSERISEYQTKADNIQLYIDYIHRMNEPHSVFNQEEDDLILLLSNEKKLEIELRELLDIVEHFLEHLKQWELVMLASIDTIQLSIEDKNDLKSRINHDLSALKNDLHAIKIGVGKYFYLDKSEEKVTKQLKKLLNPKNLDSFINGNKKMSYIAKMKREDLGMLFQKERKILLFLQDPISSQKQILSEFGHLLENLERLEYQSPRNFPSV